MFVRVDFAIVLLERLYDGLVKISLYAALYTVRICHRQNSRLGVSKGYGSEGGWCRGGFGNVECVTRGGGFGSSLVSTTVVYPMPILS